jgi:hypothetical protein
MGQFCVMRRYVQLRSNLPRYSAPSPDYRRSAAANDAGVRLLTLTRVLTYRSYSISITAAVQPGAVLARAPVVLVGTASQALCQAG